MFVLELLVWLSIGLAMPLAKITFGSLELPRPPGWPRLLALGAAAALGGGLVGLVVMRPSTQLGDFNAASIVLAGTATAIALFAQDAVQEHRARKHRRTAI